MVKQTNVKNKTYYQCGVCDLFYADKKIAQACEEWCTKTKSCNLDIIKQAVKLP